MRWLILIPIYIYWYLVPDFLKRRTCLFKESCSHFVYRKTKDEGFIAGYKALLWRIHSCRRGYMITSNAQGRFEMRLVTGKTVPEPEISEVILKPFIDAMSSVLRPVTGVKDVLRD